MTRVVFICYANRIRSRMAEGWARRLAGDRYLFESAGLYPSGPVFHDAVAVMREAGVDISEQRPRSIDEIDWDNVHVVVSLLDIPARNIAPPDFEGIALDRPTSDPVGLGLEAHRRTRDRIEATVRDLIRALDDGELS